MKWLIVTDGIIKNVIIAEEPFALSLGAFPYYDDAAIGSLYSPPVILSPEERLTALEQSKADRADVEAITAAIERGLSL